MSEKLLPFDDITKNVLTQLRNQGYMDSTLTIYLRTYNRVSAFITESGADYYTSEVGKQFLNKVHVLDSTLVAYKCAIRRLDDYIQDKPYRCHHEMFHEEIPKEFECTLNAFLDECKDAGNKRLTILKKERACISFLINIWRLGCKDLSELNAELISKALLKFSNKDNYALIRIFLKHLADSGITTTDISGIVPKYKRHKVLPTTYNPNEISKVEESLDTNTDAGKRDIAIIRLATRMGLRSGDIAKLKWSEVDFSKGYINIIQEKTGTPLSLQMPLEVSISLQMHFENTKTTQDGFVFHSLSAPYGRITTSIIRHTVSKAFTNSGVNTAGKKHGPHSFRSSIASSMINDGASYETVRKILGHSDPNVIKHYAKTDTENLRLCAIDPPPPTGRFEDYITGRKAVKHV